MKNPFNNINTPPSLYSMIIFGALLLASTACSMNSEQVTKEDYQRAEKFLTKYTRPLVHNTISGEQWLDDGRLIYRYSTADGNEFMVADPATGNKRKAFDHEKVAASLSKILDEEVKALELPFRSFSYADDGSGIQFSVKGNDYSCDLTDYECTTIGKTARRNWNEFVSPDGKKAAFIKDYNLYSRNLDNGRITQLTWDGKEDFGYATNNAGWTKRDGPVLLWSPDSKRIATFQHDGRGVGMMYLTSTNVGHPRLEAWKYPMPGDSIVFRIERVVINLEPRPKVVRLKMKPDAHRSTISDHVADWDGTFLDVEWSDDSKELAFVSSSRDHKIAHLRMANPNTGAVRSVLKEETETFYESGNNMINWHMLEGSNEVIWFSARSNWGHLYLYNLETGKLKHQITSGEWGVLQVRHIDEKNSVIYFMASNKKEEGNPYFQYLYKINFDGSGLKLLSPGEANHAIRMNEAATYFEDSYSTPTTPTVTVIRNMDGEELVKLAETDISELKTAGWVPPIPFTTKARDGETDLYGLMYKPSNFSASKSYPVLNYIYPGPQTGSVGSRSFRASRSDKQALAELGFIVVEVDALGTPGRSKSFHEYYYGNMGDNGLPDQIATIKQLAERNSWMDIDRVGIFGHSGGGFASTRAILAYPDFYKVAVSGAGNHDNRNYEDDWGEKWQGLLKVTSNDGATNYDNQANQLLAGNLKGKLLLAHGTMDNNVPPSNTMLMVNALIEANKDFDLQLLPNRRHGFYSEPYMMRRRWDYFVKNLKHVNPPEEYVFGEL